MKFPPEERALLLRTPRMGPTTVARLEGAGLGSLQLLRSLGAEQVATIICERQGSPAWMNRRRALNSVLDAACGPCAGGPGRA